MGFIAANNLGFKPKMERKQLISRFTIPCDRTLRGQWRPPCAATTRSIAPRSEFSHRIGSANFDSFPEFFFAFFPTLRKGLSWHRLAIACSPSWATTSCTVKIQLISPRRCRSSDRLGVFSKRMAGMPIASAARQLTTLSSIKRQSLTA